MQPAPTSQNPGSDPSGQNQPGAAALPLSTPKPILGRIAAVNGEGCRALNFEIMDELDRTRPAVVEPIVDDEGADTEGDETDE